MPCKDNKKMYLQNYGFFTKPLIWASKSTAAPENRLIRKELKMLDKRFKKNDSGFICENCKKEVLPLGYTSRNHCPFCLHSLHVDVNPGDRASDCGGLLVPVQALPDAKKGYIIVTKCKKCGAIRRNKSASDDDISLIIKLTVCKEML